MYKLDWRAGALKIKLKAGSIAKRWQPARKVRDLESFYKNNWRGYKPDHSYFSIRPNPVFYFKPSDSFKYKKALIDNFPDSVKKITWNAAEALAHNFNIFGQVTDEIGDKIDWHLDYKSGIRWPLKHFSRLAIVNKGDNSDVKIPWELSRLQFLSDLGRGYLISGNPLYLREFKAILLDWERGNPVDVGINWTCSMEVAIRAINIVWGLHYFEFTEEDTEFIQGIIRLLYYHGCHIEDNLEIIATGANTNHLLSDYLGLFYLGILFPEFDRAKRWMNIGLEGLEQGIAEQVKADGCSYECSTSYHRLVLEMFLSAFILGRINGVKFSEKYRNRLYGMISFSEALIAPSCQAQLIGDNDDGYIVRLSTDNPGDHRHLVDIGLLLFGERIPSRIPVSEERLWYLGPEALTRYISSASPQSRLFKESGYAIIRSNDFHLIFNAAGIPENSLGGHKHNDLLSITLELNGEPYLIDPGTYCYSSDFQLRNRSRSTLYHNTVTIDGIEQNRFHDHRLFYMFRDSRPKVNLWTNLNKSVIVSATHDGYRRLKDKIVHKRTISVSLSTNSMMVIDDLSGLKNDVHDIALQYFTAQREIEEIDDTTVAFGRKRIGSLKLKVSDEGYLRKEIQSRDYFPRYGRRTGGNLIVFHYQSRMPLRIVTVITPGGPLLTAAEQLRHAEYELKSRFGAVLR